MIEAACVHSTPRTDSSLRLAERELYPMDVLIDLFEEELLPDPAAMANRVIERLADAGFVDQAN